jgi:N-hydroxyarylamine O-acetyltransferase
MALDVERYLRRIDYSGPLRPDADTLRRLHRAHMLAVPFENLDIHIDRRITLDEARVLEKIVDDRRGGFCYELNGAFAALLIRLGFDVRLLSAEVASEEGGFDPPFDHMALLVQLDERWLADVGFGDSFVGPLRLDEPGPQEDETGRYLIAHDGEYLILEREVEGRWRPQYRFTLQPYDYSDFSQMCDYHQTSPESHFTQRRTCSRATAGGRITLTGMRLITTERGRREERAVADAAEYRALLVEHFGIGLDEQDCRLLAR